MSVGGGRSRTDPGFTGSAISPTQQQLIDGFVQLFTGTPGIAGTPSSPGSDPYLVNEGQIGQRWMPGTQATAGTPDTPGTPGMLGQGVEAYGDEGQALIAGPSSLQDKAFKGITDLSPGGDIQTWISKQLAGGESSMQGAMGGKIMDLLGEGNDLTPTLQRELAGAKEKGGPAYDAGMTSLMRSLSPFKAEDTVKNFRETIMPEAMNMFSKSLPGLIEPYVARGASSSGAMNRAMTGAGTDLISKLTAQLGGQISSDRAAHQAGETAGRSQALDFFGKPQELFGQDLGIAEQDRLRTAGLLGAGTNLQNSLQGLGQLGLGSQGQEWDQSMQMIQQLLSGGEVQQGLAGGPGAPTTGDINALQNQWTQGQAWASPWLSLLGPLTGTTQLGLGGGGSSFNMQMGL